MSTPVSALWTRPVPVDVPGRLREFLFREAGKPATLEVFFRADDIGPVDLNFSRLMHLFARHSVPLCLAVVPDWLNPENRAALRQFEQENPLWCWHQHGRSHVNHEQAGKKAEFGDSRSSEAIKADIAGGRELLEQHFGRYFCPVFTPPWNRCGKKTLDILPALGFRAISRSSGSTPPAAGILPDFAVNVDLHTRKENNFQAGWQDLLAEFGAAAESGRMGVMLHHQRMNEQAFVFLDLLLSELRARHNVTFRTFRELLK